MLFVPPLEFLNDFGGSDLFQAIVEAMPTPLLLTDGRYHVSFANRASELLFGYSVREMLDMPAELLVPSHMRPVFLDLLSSLGVESSDHLEVKRVLPILRKDGSELPKSVTAQSVEVNAGRMTCLFLEDLLPRLSLHDAEQRMSALVESAEDAILTKSLDGLIRSWNPGAERLLGYSPAQIIGRPITLLLPEDRYDEEAMILDRIRRGQRVAHFETIRRKQDGSLVDVSLTISPIRDHSGAIVGASKIMRDITERKRSESELRHRNRELAQLNADLDDFVYTASHDLRSPLTAVNSVVQWMLEDDHSLSPESQQRLALIRTRMLRMQRLMNDIRDYARSGRSAETSGPTVTAADLVKDVAALSHLPEGFAVACDPSLQTVSVRRVPLEQIFHNLINNAIKHHDRRAGRVFVSVVSNLESLRFSVIDDGPGVPADYKEAIFEMFKTLKPRDEVEGSGLGLALVRKIVGRLGGKCGVEPAGERGSNFWFDWPHSQQKERTTQ
jgi:PAS domain S-box-containing protein